MNLIKSITYYLGVYRSFIGKRLYLVFALTAVATITEGLGITLLLPLIEVVEAGDGGLDEETALVRAISSLLNFMGISDSIVGILLFIAAVFIVKGMLKFIEGAYLSYLKSQLMIEIKGGMFDAYRQMDYQYYTYNNTGHFINVINTQIHNFINSFESFTKFLSTNIISISYLLIAFLLSWNFALMALGVGILLLFLFRFLNMYVQRLSRKTASEGSTLNKFLVQTMQAYKYLTSTNQMEHLRDGVINSIRKLAGYMFRTSAAGAFTLAIREPIAVIFLLLIIIIQVSVFNAPIAPIFVALVLVYRAMHSMIGIQDGWQKTMNSIGSLEMVVDEFEKVKRFKEPTGGNVLAGLSKGIEFKNVNFVYGDQKEDVLKDVNIKIPVNKTIAFVGESGAGKSTLIDMLTLLLRPRNGAVYIDGVKGQEVDIESWRSQIGYVSQEMVVFDDTIANNICLWKGDYSKDDDIKTNIHEAAKRAYAEIFINNLPLKYDTVVGDRGVRLSGGQRQRLFIARELYKQPNLLILDEATSALDTESERFIQQSIDALKGAMTVVIIAHRLSTIKNTDYIYVLDQGRVIEEGSYEELAFNEGTRFSQMVDMQSL